MTLTIGSLFSGYGGLDMAVEEVTGARPAWFCEHEPPTEKNPRPTQAAARILAHRWPDVPNLGDITAQHWPGVPHVDILGGGFPCQDVSHGGRRAGLREGTRSGLWSRMAEAVDQLRPALVVAENVRGLLSVEAGCDVEPCPWCLGAAGDGEPALRALGAVLGDLADIGYDAAWYGLPASAVGAPHGRFRIFIVAWPADAGGTAGGEGHAEPRDGAGPAGCRTAQPGGLGGPATDSDDQRGEGRAPGAPRAGVRGEPADRRSAHPADTDRPGLERSAPASGPAQSGRAGSDGVRPVAAGCPAADPEGDGRDEGRPESARIIGGSGVAVGGAAAADAGSDRLKGIPERDQRTPTRIPAPHGDDAARRVLDWGTYGPAIARWERTLGRPAPAATEVGGKGGQRLSPAFVEWMMGLPEGHVTDVPGISRNDQLKALGNGVVPQQAAAALRVLLGHVPGWQVAA